MNIRKFISMMFTFFLVACSSIAAPTATFTPPVPTSTSTLTPTKTPAPTETPTPTVVPTPLGGGSSYILSSDCYGLYVNETELLFALAQLEQQLNKHFDCLWIDLSPTYQSALVRLETIGKQTSPGRYLPSVIDLYLLLSGGESILLASGQQVAGQWSPDGSKILITENFNTNNGSMYLVNSDGTRKFSIGVRTPYDGVPSWSYDGSKLYWSRSNKVRIIDGVTGKSQLLTDAEWLPDGPFNLSSLVNSPDGKRMAFHSFSELYITTSDFAQPQVFKLENERDIFLYKIWSPQNDRLVVSVYKKCSDVKECVRDDSTFGVKIRDWNYFLLVW